ncbi:hypothetical protein BDK51DRAFT_27470, partial [Blyttiomyces helicus]
MRSTLLETTLLSLLCVGTSSAAPTGQQCIVAHTPGRDDFANANAAFTSSKTGGTVVFSAGIDYQVSSPIAATGLSIFFIDGTVTFPYNNANWNSQLPYWQIQGTNVHISGTGSVTTDGQLWWDN